jgi:hypothetical protein
VHKNGCFLKLCNDGTVRINGDLHVEGDVYDQQGPLSRLRAHYDSHTHITATGATTSPPTPSD